MPEENVEIVRRIYDEFVDNAESIRGLFAPDLVMDSSDTAPDVGVVRGFDAVNESLRTYFDSFEGFKVGIEEVVHADEQRVIVAVLTRAGCRAVRPRSGTAASMSGLSATAGQLASRPTLIETRPSGPPVSPSSSRAGSPISDKRQDTAHAARTAAA